MISAPDRRQTVELIDEARKTGARLEPACRLIGITVRTYERWTASGTVQGDRRPESPRPVPRNKLSAKERAQVLSLCHEPAYASLPPGPDRSAIGRPGRLYRLRVELLPDIA
jgi:hypothetical protein